MKRVPLPTPAARISLRAVSGRNQDLTSMPPIITVLEPGYGLRSKHWGALQLVHAKIRVGVAFTAAENALCIARSSCGGQKLKSKPIRGRFKVEKA